MNDIHTQFLNPDRARDYLTQADIHAKSKDYQKAIEALREAFKYQPNSPEAHLLGAKIYLKVGMYENAYDFIENLHKHNPPSEDSLLLKAKAELLLERPEECEGTLDDIFASRRDNPDALILLADLHFARHKFSEAIGIYERLHDKDKSNHDIIYSLALAYFNIQDYNETLYYCSILKKGGPVDRAVESLYEKALREKKKEFVKKKGDVTFIDRLRLLIHDPYTNEQIRIHSEMERNTQRSNRQTYIDNNTGALNFKAMQEYIPTYLMASKEGFFLCQLDIDFFKLFNDKFSHQVGDIVLRALAQMGGTAFPQRFFRKGGEEFVWVFDGSDEKAIEMARSFRIRVEKYATSEANNLIVNMQLKNKQTGDLYQIDRNITISMGLAKYQQDGRNPTELLEAADHGLIKAKGAGRNAVVYKDEVVDQGEKPIKLVSDSR